jgi:hypothetical protein
LGLGVSVEEAFRDLWILFDKCIAAIYGFYHILYSNYTN